MTTIAIDDNTLSVLLTGWPVVFALKRRLDVPLDHVVSPRTGAVPALRPDGLRLPGAFVPRVIAAGSDWWRECGWSFWSVRRPDRAVDIRLREERFARIVVEAADPDATAAEIERAVAARVGRLQGEGR